MQILHVLCADTASSGILYAMYWYDIIMGMLIAHGFFAAKLYGINASDAPMITVH